MRLIKNYYFDIGTKIPYSEWPEIVHQFLAENKLVSHRFLYYFSEFTQREDALQSGSCAKIRKDCPSINEIRTESEDADTWKRLYITNLDG